MAQSKTTGPVITSPEAAYMAEERNFDTQRSGFGPINYLLFPMIAFAALAFAAAELVR